MTVLSDADLARLAVFLRECGEPVAGDLTAELVTGGRSNLTYRLSDGSGRWILRRPPSAGLTPTAHDMGREYRVCAALWSTRVPVARAVGEEPTGAVIGVPFAVVEHVDGVAARSRADIEDWRVATATACAGELVSTLAALHAVDVDAVGLGDLARRGDHAARQLRRWSGQWAQMGSAHPLERRLQEALLRRLPAQRGCSLVHGDYRIDNVLLDPTRPAHVLAVLDWEMATLGDPASDVALMAAYRHPALDEVLGLEAAWTDARFPTGDELRAAYEQEVGCRIEGWDVHLALAFYKLAAIAEGIAYRHRQGARADGDEDGERAARAVPQFLEAGLERMGARV